MVAPLGEGPVQQPVMNETDDNDGAGAFAGVAEGPTIAVATNATISDAEKRMRSLSMMWGR